jgi:hypothetical protein
MPYPVSQAVTLTLGGTAVPNVTQVAINESAPTIETSDLSLAAGAYRTFLSGLKDAADITLNHIGTTLAVGSGGAFVCGAITFAGSTVMSSEVAYRVGEIVAYTTTLRASN